MILSPQIQYATVRDLPCEGNVCIYGAGGAGSKVKKMIDEKRKDIRVMYFIDTFKGGEFEGVDVVHADKMKFIENEYDSVLVASTYWREIVQNLMLLKIDKTIIVVLLPMVTVLS